MARNIDESDQVSPDLEPERPLTRRERRALEQAGIPHQSRGEDDAPATGDPDSSAQAEQEEVAAVRSGDVVPSTTRRRRRSVPVLVLGIVLALVAAGGYLWWQRQNSAPAPAAPPLAADQTLFLSLTTDDGRSAGGLLYLAHRQDAFGVLVPADVTLDAPRAGTTSIREAQLAGPDVPGQAVSDATAVPVDGHWVLPFDGLAALVDAVGGITVDVDVPLQVDGVALSPGEQELTGGQAATYAGWSLTGEPRVGQLVRSGQVVHAVIGALPDHPDQITDVLARASGQTTLEPADLAAFLARVHTAQADGAFGGSLVPTIAAPTADNPDALALDVPTFTSWVQTATPGLQVHRPGEAGRVRVMNAAAVEHVQDPARGLLLRDGFTYTFGGAADPIQPTSIVMFSPARDTRDQALAAATALGLDATAVQSSDDVPLGQDVVILLGEDFAVSQGMAVPLAPGEGAPADQTPEGQATEGQATEAEPAPAEPADG